MSLVRTLLFILLTGVYLVVCPLLILYALGYIYNPVQPGFVRTGIVDIVTVPSGAEVYLEGSRFVRTTPTLLGELLPGEYTITLRKKGYLPWRQTVLVTAGKAVAFKNIVLVPESWPQKTLTMSACQNLIPMDSRYLFILKSGPELGECMAYSRDGQTRPVLPPGCDFASYPATTLRCVPDSDAFVVYSDSFWHKRDLYVSLEGREPNAVDITDLAAGRPSFMTWSPDEPGRLFAVEKDCVMRLDVARNKRQACYLEGVRGLGIYGNWLYIIDHNDALVRMPFDKQHGEYLRQDESLGKRLFSTSDFYDIRARRRGVIFFLGTQGDLVGNIPPYRVTSSDASDIVFNGRSDMFAWWTKTSIGQVDFSRNFDKTMFQERFKRRTVFEGGKDIRQVFWAYKDSHILFNDNGEIYLLELEPQEPHHVERVVTVKRDTSVYYDADDRSLYYLDEKNGMLKRLQLIPE
jgi:hypothetical protein